MTFVLRLSPSARGALQLALQVFLAATLFAVLLALAVRHNVRFDMTRTKSFVLTEPARKVAASVRERVRITVFYDSQQSGRRRDMADVLEQFRAANPLLSYRLLDLDRSPREAERLGVATYNTGVVEAGERQIPLRGIDQEEIVAALLRLTGQPTAALCFFIGHGEHSPLNTDDRRGYSEVAKALENENFLIRVFSTVGEEGVPEGCTMVILAGPTADLLPAEEQALTVYLRGGGKVLFMIDPETPVGIVRWLANFGVETANALIVDERNRFMGSDSFTARVPIFDQGVFGDGLNTAAVFPLARPLRPIEDNPPTGVKVGLLALTSSDSWALMNPDETPDKDVSFRRGIDFRGPLPVGLIASIASADGGTPGQLVVFGDSDFASNFYLNILGNKDLFMSTVAVLTANRELVGERRKGLTRGSLSPIVLTAEQGRTLFWTAVVIEPVIFLLAAVVVAIRQRRRRGGR